MPYFWMSMKKVNDFQVARILSQGVFSLLFIFFCLFQPGVAYKKNVYYFLNFAGFLKMNRSIKYMMFTQILIQEKDKSEHEQLQRLKVVDHFRKQFHHRCLKYTT